MKLCIPLESFGNSKLPSPMSMFTSRIPCQANPDGGAPSTSGLWKSARDVCHPLRRHAPHHQEEERTLEEGRH